MNCSQQKIEPIDGATVTQLAFKCVDKNVCAPSHGLVTTTTIATSTHVCAKISPVPNCDTYNNVSATGVQPITTSYECTKCKTGYYLFNDTGNGNVKSCIKRVYSASNCLKSSDTADQCLALSCASGFYSNSENFCVPNPTGIRYCSKYD